MAVFVQKEISFIRWISLMLILNYILLHKSLREGFKKKNFQISDIVRKGGGGLATGPKLFFEKSLDTCPRGGVRDPCPKKFVWKKFVYLHKKATHVPSQW